MNAFVSSLFFHGASFGTLMLLGIGGGFGNASAPDTLLEVSLMSSGLSGAKVGKVNSQNDFSVEETGNFSTENLQNADVVEEIAEDIVEKNIEVESFDVEKIASAFEEQKSEIKEVAIKEVEVKKEVELKNVEPQEVKNPAKKSSSTEKPNLESKTTERRVENTSLSASSLSSFQGEELLVASLFVGEGTKEYAFEKKAIGAGILPQAQLLSLNEPGYPQRSRQAGEEGLVKIEVYVNNKGKVEQARILVSSGYERLDNAALKAVKSSKYAPISGYIIVPILFELKS